MNDKLQAGDFGDDDHGNERTQQLPAHPSPSVDETQGPAPDLTVDLEIRHDGESMETIDLVVKPIGELETIVGAEDITRGEGESEGLSQTIDVDMAAMVHSKKSFEVGASDSKKKPSRGKSGVSNVGAIIGNYEVLSILGKGGMGIVYKARHRTLDRIVALKMILHGLHGGDSAVKRFLAEARSVASLQHPGIVQIFEIGEHQGLPYFSLEYVDGEDLHSSLKGQPWSAKASCELVATLCDAMQYAHDHQILHRDIKPANILLDLQKRPKISDFGLAKKLDTGDQMTRDGAVVGTPSYMPPEQARGDSAAISNRSDVYSLGAVLYQMITGRAPFVSDSMMDTLVQVINRDPVQPRELQPGIPIDLETICIKALQKEPNNRYQSCSEMAQDLRRYLNGEPILARPISSLERLTRWCRRNPRVAWPTAIAGFFVIATAGVSLTAWRVTAAQAAVIAEERDNANDQRDEADKQRIEADKQRLLANQQQVVAEENAALATKQANLALENIQFVVSKVDELLASQPGSNDTRLAILEAVSKKSDELDQSLTGGIQGEAPATLMALRHKIAGVYRSLDKLDLARAEYEKLYEQAQARIVIKGRTDSARLNKAKVAQLLSEIRERSGDIAASASLLDEAIDLVRDIIKNPSPQKDSPKPDHILEVLAAALQNRAVMYLKEGAVTTAATTFRESLETHAKLLSDIRSAPGFAEMNDNQKDSATASKQIQHDKTAMGLAYAELRLGKTEASISYYEKAIAARREIFERRKTMLPLKTELAGFLGIYGESLLWIDQPDKAEPFLKESLQLADEILAADPEKADYKRAVATAAYQLGMLRDVQKRADEALGLFEKSRLRRQELFAISQDDKNKANLLLSEARVGNIEFAKKLSDELGATDKKNPNLHLLRACALSQLSRISEGARISEGDRQVEFRDAALSALERSVADGYSDPFRIETELDLDPLHETDRFKTLVLKLRATK